MLTDGNPWLFMPLGIPYTGPGSADFIALAMHALSIPTWVIHITSVVEWVAAIGFIWQYAEVSQRWAWRTLSLGMLPALVSAMCACTWHFFDNMPALAWLVTLQAAMTVVGNCTICAAAWWIWRQAKGVKS